MFTIKRLLNAKAFILVMLIFVLSSSIVFADNALEDMDNKIDKQNDELYEVILENKKDSPNIMDEMIKESNKKNASDVDEFSLERLASGIERGSILLAVKARKYIVPITILILLFNIFMLSATGAKNLKNRKKYIVSSVFFYLFFLIILNLPLYILWRNSIGPEEFLNLNAFYRLAEGISSFLKANSFVFSVIIFTFGVVNKISSDSNIPKILASNFMIKMSFILYALFNLMPFIMKLAI